MCVFCCVSVSKYLNLNTCPFLSFHCLLSFGCGRRLFLSVHFNFSCIWLKGGYSLTAVLVGKNLHQQPLSEEVVWEWELDSIGTPVKLFGKDSDFPVLGRTGEVCLNGWL